ncbi:MAG: cyclic nucleotide-binding domain-containing protein [Proteobacteria bacterium]|nr:cyclic nucleotide-binding domain-containing protein [Pseudomonadota bacterium]
MSEIEQFSQCVPVNSLTNQHLKALFAESRIEKHRKGEVLFDEGDNDGNAIYLLEGAVEIVSKRNKTSRTIESGADASHYALAQLKPRQYTGKALTDVTIACIDSGKLDQYLTMDQMASDIAVNDGGIEVSEVDAEIDTEWMFDLMRRDTFKQLPAERFTELINHFEPVETVNGDVVITQGEAGDYYYVIREGQFKVSRKTSEGKVGVLATLNPGDVFGEEALISNAPRNASVISTGEGLLMRLSKTDFDELLKPSLVKTATHAEIEAMLKAGAGLLDVRTEDEFAQGALKVAKNVPLFRLRRVLDQLDKDRRYILCCLTGMRSNTAAFLMNQRGFDVYVLAGGLQGLKKQAGS